MADASPPDRDPGGLTPLAGPLPPELNQSGPGSVPLSDQRGLKVILFSDVVDSSGRMFDDEAGTVALIERDLALFARHLAACGGALIKNTGDGILATFATTVQALTFLRGALGELRQLQPALQHRFGMHIGEIYLRDDDILGQGVHLAARLQSVSPVNGVAFTEGTYANLAPGFRERAVSLGALELKGLPGKVRCHALRERALLQGEDPDPTRSLRSRLGWWQRRLSRSRPAQALAAGVLVGLGLFADLDPAQPVAAALLDRRLLIQRLWREITGQIGPLRPALPIVLLSDPAPLLPRQRLSSLLEQLPPQRFPAVALDLVLDRVGPDPAATARLVALIRRQQRPSLVVGFFGGQSSGIDGGRRSLPLPELRQAGVLPRDLTIGTAAGPGPIQPTPLQLLAPVGADHLASALAGGAERMLPTDAVIDWSLAWGRMLRVVTLEALPSGGAPVLLVGRLSDRSASGADLFQTPAAFLERDPLWGGTAREMPGPLLQAVVGQSLALGHWLTPLSSGAWVALAAGSGVLLAAALPQRRRRLMLLALVLPPAMVLSLQLATGSRLLTPIVLPSLALAATGLLRPD
jgi:class 3 adenylate cyclase